MTLFGISLELLKEKTKMICKKQKMNKYLNKTSVSDPFSLLSRSLSGLFLTSSHRGFEITKKNHCASKLETMLKYIPITAIFHLYLEPRGRLRICEN